MGKRFAGKVALVTGGGSGIGRAVALALGGEGAVVAVAGRTEANLADTVRLIEEAGGTATAITADVTSERDVAAMVDTVVRRADGLDIAFNNAGVLAPGALADLDEADWLRTLSTNVTGVWLSMKYEIRHMRGHGGGVIVNTSSTLGPHIRVPGVGAYSASKAAVSALTRTAALEYAADGIRVNAISPGPMETTMSLLPGETEAERAARLKRAIPAGRPGTMSEAASAVLWLASDDAGFTVGHDLVLDGGASA
ncbi:MAG TPA: SDR family oxidoreductase [Pseudonocardia sp.]|uniref:SDR family NAD(P)-dependent oxidoreductase n=1 Tax=Pseudonocardia sp. TaxID=60912 RepID=UPI002BEEE7B4|nr:SDR family oxidoreductase [Pseudonocardia sp.]HTF49388.1 SDR family oxidoreductase [Pseudonocardia sp.]